MRGEAKRSKPPGGEAASGETAEYFFLVFAHAFDTVPAGGLVGPHIAAGHLKQATFDVGGEQPA
jgi:hypothetical protein